jgi:hypothetical protein
VQLNDLLTRDFDAFSGVMTWTWQRLTHRLDDIVRFVPEDLARDDPAINEKYQMLRNTFLYLSLAARPPDEKSVQQAAAKEEADAKTRAAGGQLPAEGPPADATISLLRYPTPVRPFKLFFQAAFVLVHRVATSPQRLQMNRDFSEAIASCHPSCYMELTFAFRRPIIENELAK